MPVVKVFMRSQWDEFVRGLDALPDKPASERGMTVREAMKELKSHIRTAQNKGYTLGQIAEQAKRAGVDISAGTLKLALRESSNGSVLLVGNGSSWRAYPCQCQRACCEHSLCIAASV
jgi:hypothetical protein